MSLVVEFSMVPLGSGESVGDAVAAVVAEVRDSGLPYRLSAMGTTVEGEWTTVMALLERCHRLLEGRSDRVYTVVKMDWRRGRRDQLDGKVRAVTDRLPGEVET